MECSALSDWTLELGQMAQGFSSGPNGWEMGELLPMDGGCFIKMSSFHLLTASSSCQSSMAPNWCMTSSSRAKIPVRCTLASV